MTNTSEANKERNREIAQNEEAKQVTGSVRVSISAIVAVVIVGGILFMLGWLALR
jgi:cobalamin biosynthesis Mg chelatase CobN